MLLFNLVDIGKMVTTKREVSAKGVCVCVHAFVKVEESRPVSLGISELPDATTGGRIIVRSTINQYEY